MTGIGWRVSYGSERVLPHIRSGRRLSLASNGNVVIALKTPYDDGTTHVVLSPMEFMGRLAALVPRPRVILARFHGVFSPNSKLREHAVPQKPKAYSMTCAQRLKHMFAIEIEKCEQCGVPVRSIASIEDPEVIQKILKHLGLDRPRDSRNRSPPVGLLDQLTLLLFHPLHRGLVELDSKAGLVRQYHVAILWQDVLAKELRDLIQRAGEFDRELVWTRRVLDYRIDM